MKREAKLSTRGAELLAAVDEGRIIERQHRGIEGWHVVAPQVAVDAISHGDEVWFRVQPGTGRSPAIAVPSVVVFGPQGCGKSRYAEHLRKHFGLDHVRDLSHRIGVRPAYGTLFLTASTPADLIATGVIDKLFRRAYAFEHAMQAAGVAVEVTR